MATVSIPGFRDPIEVPDEWDRGQVTDYIRRNMPDLFEAEIPAGPSPVTLGPDRAPLSPEARAARLEALRAELAAPIPDPDPAPSAASAVPRRIAAGALNFLRAPLAMADAQLAPLFLADRSRPAAEEIARRIESLRSPISQLQSDLRRPAEGEAPAPESLGDVARTFQRIGPAAAAADAGTLATNFVLENVPQLLSGGLVARALSAARVPAGMARVLGPLISAAPVETAGALEEYLSAGADPVGARIAAPLVGLVNGLLESAPDARLLRRLGRADPEKTSAARFIVGQLFGEAGTEVAQEGVTVAGRAALTGSPGPNLLDRFATAAFGGAAAGLGMGGATELASQLTAPPAIGPIGAPVRVARGEGIPAGDVLAGSVPIAEAPVPGGLAPAREYAPIGRRRRRAAMDLARVANEEGVADLVDFIYEPKRTAEGAPIEAEFEGGRMRIYVPNIRNVDRLRGALREEKAHGWIATEAGQAALTEFLDQQPLTEPELRQLQDAGYAQLPDEDVGAYTRRLSDEFVAKLNRESGWKRRFGEVVAFVKRAIGVRLSNVQAGRLMLRNLRRAGAAGGAARQSVSPGLSLSGKNLPDWAREEMLRRGMDPARALNDIDIGNPSVREAVELDPTLSAEEKARLLATGSVRQSLDSFETERGSTYVRHPDGTTTRTKSPRPGESDAGEKTRSARTVFVNSQLAREIGMWQTSSATGKRIVLANGRVYLLSRNAAGGPGLDRTISDPTFSDEPAIGLHPLEVWEPDTAYLPTGHVVYRGNHPGNAIVKMGSSAPRQSLDSEALLSSIRSEFPSAPPIIEAPGGPAPASFDGSNILVDPVRLPANPRDARAEILAALASSGAQIPELAPDALIEDAYSELRRVDPEGLAIIEGRLGVDAPAPRRAVIAEALRTRPARSFLRRLAERLRISPASPALDRIADSVLRAMEIAEPLPRRAPLAPEQAFADANHGVWTIARPYIEALRALAMDSRFSDEDERAHRNMGNRLRSLADNARARNLGAGSQSPALNPRSEKFLDEVRASGETVSEADETLHSRYVLESEARDLVRLRDEEEDLASLIEDLARLAPNFDRSEDDGRLAAIRKMIADLAAKPPVDDRAVAIRASRQRRDESKAAALVLLDPQVRALREIIERIENSGATPRESPDPGLADARRAGTDSLILSWRPFRRRTEAAYDQFMAEVYPEKLRELAAALRAARESRADARVAVGEILAAISGRMGLSGSREDRATADFLREEDALLRRFVVLLAGASPTDPVARLRDRISRIPDTAPAYTEAAAQLDAELGASTFVETPRYEVSGISPDDVRALFGTESRTANPELYDFFAKLPAARKKEVVRKAMKGIVDDQLAALASRRQVGTDVTEVPGRAATAEELRARFFQIIREAMDDARLSDIRVAAEAAGVSPDALGRLVQFIESSDGSRNAVMEAVRAIDRSTEESALAAVREIEQSLSAPARPGVSERDVRAARRLVSERAAPAIARFSRAQGAAADAAAGIRREISELEARRLALLRLRDMGAAEMPEPESAVREMVTETEGGDIRFHSFIRADGSEAPEVRIGAEDEYSQDLLERIAKWQEDARDAAAAASNPEPETRGLRVAVPLANLYLSANFLPSELGRSPAPSTLQYLSLGSWATLWQKISTRNNLGKLIPGLRGNLLRARTRAMDSAEKYGETIRRRYVRRVLRAERAAMESLGLSPRVLGDSELLRIARNEVAHRIGRVFGSDVSAGDRFLSPELGGRTVTPELLNLLRLDREIGRKAQEFEAKRPYGGIRIDAPEGVRFVRPPAETGDFGLSRLVDPEPVRALARAYHSKDAARIAAFWDNAEESRNGLLWHFESAARADAGTPRSMAAAEATIARRIAHGAVPAPSSIDEAVSLLAAESGRSRAEVRKDLLAELAEYGRLAMARFERDGSDTPKSRETAVGSLADDSAFVLSAAPLIYPASWYNYGTSGGMNSFVESMLRVPAREYASAALAGAAELERIAADLRKDPAAHPQEVRWFTNTVDRQLRSLFGMDRAESAANAMTYVADQLRRDAALARNETRPDSKIARLLTGLTPFMLMWTGTAAANIQSGPVLAYFLMEPFHGKTVAAAKTLAAFASAVPHFALDRIEAALAKLGFEFGSRAERQSFLDGYGIGSSYSRAELGEIEAFARGRAALSGAGRAATAATEAASAVGMRFGAGMGDAVLNSHLLRTVVPDIFRKMKRIAAVYAGRLASEGKTFDIRDPSTYLSDADARGASEIREMLLPFADRGGSPEEILLHIAGIDARRFWRDPLAADLAQFFLTEMNVATRSNRPQGNPLLMLFGWSSHAIAKIAEAMRTRPDDPALRKLANSALSAAAISGLLGVAYFAQKLARRGVQVAQTEGAEGLRDLLLGLDGDDDEEVDGIYDALAKLARLIRTHVPGAHIPLDFAARAAGAAVTPPTDPNPTPFDRSFYSLPVREMLSELAIAPIRGVGIDPANPRTAAFGIGETILRSVISAGRGAATAIEGALAGDAGLKAAGGADLRDAARRAAGLFSIAGSFAFNLLAPEASVARSVRADIVGAARRAGVRISRPPASMMGLVPSVPVEESLRIAANSGDSEGARAILSFAHDRAYRRAIEGGKSEREAKTAGEGAVRSLLVALDPIRDAVGGPVSPEEHRKILGILGDNRKARAAIAARDRTVAAIAAEPPAGMRRFSPSPSMRSPERRPRGGRRARAPRAGYLGSRRRSPASRRRALLRRRSRARSVRRG